MLLWRGARLGEHRGNFTLPDLTHFIKPRVLNIFISPQETIRIPCPFYYHSAVYVWISSLFWPKFLCTSISQCMLHVMPISSSRTP